MAAPSSDDNVDDVDDDVTAVPTVYGRAQHQPARTTGQGARALSVRTKIRKQAFQILLIFVRFRIMVHPH